MLTNKKPRRISARVAIREMVRIIVRDFSPGKVILFGSHARGDATKDSDIDILVVMPLVGTRRQARLEIGLAVRGVNFAKDIIVTTPDDYEWRKDYAGTIERFAFLDGKLLYARK